MEYIDMTPTWEGILPVLVQHFNCSDPKDELRKMSQLADKYVLEHKNGKLSQIIHDLMEFTPEDERESFEKRLEELGL